MNFLFIKVNEKSFKKVDFSHTSKGQNKLSLLERGIRIDTYTIGSLISIIESGKLDNVGNASIMEMIKKEKEKLVKERFGEITEHTKMKNGSKVTYFMAYDGRKQITASTREKLVEKLLPLSMGTLSVNTTLEELFKPYSEYRLSDTSIASNTSQYAPSNWKRFFDGTEFSKKKVVSLTATDVLDFYKSIVGRGKITKKAFDKAKGVLNGMLDFAIEKGIVKINVARTVNTSKFSFAAEKDNSNAVYTPEDRDVLIKYVKGLPQTRYTLAIRLMACFPLRMGELRALTWEDYDVKNKKLLIHHEIVKEARDGKNRCDLDVPFVKGAKDSGVRKLPVSSEAAKIFELLREINGSKKYILNGERNAMFSLPENKINEHLRAYCNECGITYYSSHKFRFYGATQLYRAGVPLATISYYLGHSNLKTTMHYLRLTPEDASNEIIESIFG